MIISDPQERNRFLRFAVVGVVGAVVDFGIFNLLVGLVGIRALVASIISFLAAVISNFIWNRFWTYPDSRSKPIRHQLVQFGIVSMLGLAIRTGLFAWLEPLVILLAGKGLAKIGLTLSPVTIGHNLTLAICVGIVMMWNFYANRFWTYSDVSNNPENAKKPVSDLT